MTEPDPARSRFIALQLVRFAGVLIVMAAVLVWQTDVLTPAPNPDKGKLIFAVGLFMTLVVPPILRRRWRTPG